MVLGHVSELWALAVPPFSQLAAVRTQEQQAIAGLAEHCMDVGDEMRVGRESWIELAVLSWWWQIERNVTNAYFRRYR